MKSRFLMLFFVIVLTFACSKQEFGGLGIEVPSGKEKISKKNPYIIINTFEGFPAYNAGLQKDDIILSIDGIDLNGLTQEYVYKQLLRGKPGAKVILKIRRKDQESIYQLVRQKIILQE